MHVWLVQFINEFIAFILWRDPHQVKMQNLYVIELSFAQLMDHNIWVLL